MELSRDSFSRKELLLVINLPTDNGCCEWEGLTKVDLQNLTLKIFVFKTEPRIFTWLYIVTLLGLNLRSSKLRLLDGWVYSVCHHPKFKELKFYQTFSWGRKWALSTNELMPILSSTFINSRTTLWLCTQNHWMWLCFVMNKRAMETWFSSPMPFFLNSCIFLLLLVANSEMVIATGCVTPHCPVCHVSLTSLSLPGL